MKTIRILGLGSRSTQFYIDYLNHVYNEQYGGYSTCPFNLSNIDFNQINPFLPDSFEALVPTMKNVINDLKLKDEVLLIPNVTLHETTDQLDFNKIIHPVTATIDQLHAKNVTNITLVGTNYTVRSPNLMDQFQQAKIEVQIPSTDDIRFIDEIRLKTYAGLESEDDVQAFNNLLRSFSNRATPVIACTELSINLNKSFHEFDMARNQINACFRSVFQSY